MVVKKRKEGLRREKERDERKEHKRESDLVRYFYRKKEY